MNALDQCPIMRHVVVTHGTFNMVTGKSTPTRTEKVVKACGVPLFGKARDRGICNSCAQGWEVEANYPTEEGRAAIAKAGGAA